MHWPTLFKNLTRVALTVGIVVAIGAAILLLHPGQEDGVEVSSSHADVLWSLPFQKSNTQRFASALEDLGHEPPRSYDLNGNEVFFSTRTTHKTPEHLLQEYQHKFVEKGVNSREWVQTTDALSRMKGSSSAIRKRFSERSEAAIDGEIVPHKVMDRYMSMTGMLFDSAAEDEPSDEGVAMVLERSESAAEQIARAYKECGGDPDKVEEQTQNLESEHLQKLDEAISRRSSCGGKSAAVCTDWSERLKKAQKVLQAHLGAIEEQPELVNCEAISRYNDLQMHQASRDFTEKIEGFRSIEAFRHAELGQTVVTAAWSDDDFDMTKVLPSEYGMLDDEDGKLPACQSCKRAWSFLGSGGEADMGTEQFWSQRSTSQVAADYLETLAAHGWEYRDADPVMGQLYRHMNMPSSDGLWMRFARGNNFLTLHVRPNQERQRTVVTAFRAN